MLTSGPVALWLVVAAGLGYHTVALENPNPKDQSDCTFMQKIGQQCAAGSESKACQILQTPDGRAGLQEFLTRCTSNFGPALGQSSSARLFAPPPIVGRARGCAQGEASACDQAEVGAFVAIFSNRRRPEK